MEYKRMHPIYILEGVYKLIPLLVFPLLRGFAAALKGGMYLWLSGTWMDISAVLVIALLAILRWRMTEYACDGAGISVRGGLFKRNNKVIPLSEICSISCESPWFYRPFSATRIRFDTLGGTNRRADISLTIDTDTAHNIMASVQKSLNPDGGGIVRRYSPRLLYIMIISAFLSNSFAGVAFASTFVTKLGSVAGKELETQFFGTFNNIVRLISFGIPPVAAAIAYIMLGGWIIGFVLNLIRHQGFTLCRDKNTLLIKGGKVTPRATLLKADQINFITIKQGLFTKLMGIYTVFGYCAGLGKKKEDITTLTPAGNKGEIKKNFRMLLPEFERADITLSPNAWALFRFIGDPLWPCALLPAATAYLMKHFKSWEELVLFIGFMTCIPAYWWLAVRITDFATSGIGINDSGVTLKYSKFLQLNTVIIPWNKIVSVSLRQSVFQRLDKKCDVIVYTRAEAPDGHRVRNVDIDKARMLLKVGK